ncbi:MAG: phage holin family protein [Actinophytocola sp.]|uniref:phage holin family protein n=1 Tax=Actinophytocola sp. TaxID=1872138 RepID=UPI003D6A4448
MSSISDVGAHKPASEKSTAELVRDLTEQFSHLARTEVRLAVHEAQDKAKHAGIGAASIGAAGVLAGYGLAIVLAGLVLLLALALPAWVAAMIVGAVVLLAAGVAALVAKKQFRRSAPMPSDAVDSAKEDIQVVKEAAKR